MSTLRKLGASIEDRVAEYLLGLGYTLLSRRCHLGCGELDIIALDGEVIVFVEVKYRQKDIELALESITPKKIEHLKSAAERYLYEQKLMDQDVRFDVVVVTQQQLIHYQCAFD